VIVTGAGEARKRAPPAPPGPPAKVATGLVALALLPSKVVFLMVTEPSLQRSART